MSGTRRRMWVLVGVLAGAVLGLLLTIPIGSTTTDCFPATKASPICGTFDQSILVKTRYPYPHWIPAVGALVGAALGLVVILALQRWSRTRAASG